MPTELDIERAPELIDVPVDPMSMYVPIAPALIVPVAFVAEYVPPVMANPKADSSQPAVPATDPVLA